MPRYQEPRRALDLVIRPPFSGFYPDESVTSWHRRQSRSEWPRINEEGLLALKGADSGDLDFGPIGPGNRIPGELLNVFRLAGHMPASLVLPYSRRSLYCVWCHRDDLARGACPYMRRYWTIGW